MLSLIHKKMVMVEIIVLFDGECNLCHNFVKFIIKHSKKRNWKFQPLQSPSSKILSNKYPIKRDAFDTVYVIKNAVLYDKSNAVLIVLTSFGGIWNLSYICYLLPKKIRDYIYLHIAKYRFKLFGRSKSCMLPSENFSDRV